MFETLTLGFSPVLRVSLLAIFAVLTSQLFRQLRLPESLGALAVGVVLGPSAVNFFGGIPSEAGQALQTWAFNLFYWSGLSVLMFVAGNSMLFSRSEKVGARTWILAASTLAVLVPAYLTSGLAIELAGGNPMRSEFDAKVYQIVFTLCAVVTSVPFLTKILRERQLLETRFAKTALLAACMVDLVLWLLLGVVHNLHKGEVTDASGIGHALWPNLAIYIFTLIMMALIRTFVAWYGSPISGARVEFAFGCSLLFAAVVATTAMGGEVMIAALCAGMLHANCGLVSGQDRIIWRRAEIGFVPLYFAAIGVSLTFSGTFSLWHMAVFILWSTVLKIGFVGLSLYVAYPRDTCNGAFAVAMNTRGGPGIAMASIAFAAGMFDNTTFLTVVAASFVTALMTDRFLVYKSGLIRCQT